ncbi:class I SAM-dependent methyltransferase [Paracoccus sp. MBLB3053]|uniref:Class I SAM-dependent methyltransferase n=1 Tax=Paracoccus aurantius TaxID=3073814 RepID=A0ABU2HX21_9RHOB|nr:class I SAM-dependent methyltransferase [Paracoccus sp. MBLB3053]MDS9469602.1 class I SAM-dependent methyltransferase [Paracoccus sp. MBLB3053]
MTHEHSPFTNVATVASYAENARRNVPGLSDLHRMVTLLLAERAPEEAHILVVGAGGGMEISAMAEARPMWRFTGVDPSVAMLHLAKEVLRPYCDRVDLIEGTAEDLPSRTFDGATCLLTFHHLNWHERLQANSSRSRKCPFPRWRTDTHSNAAASHPASCANCSIATFSPRNRGSIGKAMSPQNRCMELAPPLAASRDSKDDAGSKAACGTVSGN